MAEIPLAPRRRPRKEKEYRPRNDFIDSLEDEDFRKRFRLSKNAFRQLVDLLRDQLAPINGSGGSNGSISAEQKVLNFYKDAVNIFMLRSLFP